MTFVRGIYRQSWFDPPLTTIAMAFVNVMLTIAICFERVLCPLSCSQPAGFRANGQLITSASSLRAANSAV
jgi:hypothetical protein